MNFAMLLLGEQTTRNSDSVLRSAMVTTISDGATPVRMVRNHEPKERHTASLWHDDR
jgi:hypothetical protein